MHCDTLSVVAGYLAPRDLGRCARVCRRWNRWINSFEKWRELRRLFRNVVPTKQWLFEQDNTEQLEAIVRMHFTKPTLIADVSHGSNMTFHVQIIQFINDEWDWERPIWIWMKGRLQQRLRARWGRYHFAEWPGPDWRQIFTPYFSFLQYGQPKYRSSVLSGWRFRARP